MTDLERVAGIAALLSGTVMAKDTQLHLLTDPGLDDDSQQLVPPEPNIPDRWTQENASLVIGIQPDGVAPSDGTGMLALFHTSLNASQVWQRINVSHLADKIDQGLITAHALGRINASEDGVLGGTIISASAAGIGALGTLGNGTGGVRQIDGDPSTWETTYSYLVLPVGTRFVEFQFIFSNESLVGGKIGYGDEAVVVLSEWSDGTESCDMDDPNANIIMGTPGNDTALLGTPGDDVIFGLGGNDTIYGLGGNDCIDGGEGDDKIFAGPGTDTCVDGESLSQCEK
jgi:Ca2+-binding RTX toxin-like protein